MIFPIAILKSDSPIIYFYDSEKDLRKTSEEILINEAWNKYIIIDSIGEKYSILSVKKVGLRAIFGWHPLLKGKSIWVEFMFSEGEKIDLNSIKRDMILRVEKATHFYEIAWNISDLKKAILNSKDFNELIILFR